MRRLAEEFRIERGALIDNAFSDVVLRGLYYKGCARSKPEVLINFTDKENQVMTHSEIKSGVVLFQRTVVLLSFYVLSSLIVKVSHRGD